MAGLEIAALLVGIRVWLRVRLAFLSGLVGRRWSFVRTPKNSIADTTRAWRGKAYVPRADGKTAMEAILAAIALAAAGLGSLEGWWAISVSRGRVWILLRVGGAAFVLRTVDAVQLSTTLM